MTARPSNPRAPDRVHSLVGASTIACVLVGVVGLGAAVVAWGDNDWQGGGLCLLASAVAFGLLLNALLR